MLVASSDDIKTGAQERLYDAYMSAFAFSLAIYQHIAYIIYDKMLGLGIVCLFLSYQHFSLPFGLSLNVTMMTSQWLTVFLS